MEDDGPAVLLVDDDAAIRRTVGAGLELEGFRVVPASGGRSALAAAESVRPAVVLLDLAMPDLGGLEVLRRLRERGDDVAAGDAGNDRVDGGSGDDTLLGGGERDVITGGPGSDTIAGGLDVDIIRARDGESDSVTCGPGSDRVTADPEDRIAQDCEQVIRE